MVTSYLSEAEVEAYIADLAQRLENLQPHPAFICALGRSGKVLVPYLTKHPVTDEADTISIDVQMENGQRRVLLDDDACARIRGQRILLLDGAIHSGGTMAACVRHLLDCGAEDVCSYALVVKREASFVPSLFGVMVNDTDRVYYLLAPLPNNRLQTGKRPPFCGHIRKLDETDLDRPPLASGVPSIDRVTWADRHYDTQCTASRCTYLLEAGKHIVGFLTVSQSQRDVYNIDEVAVDPTQRGKGYGGILLRFAETLARHSGHRTIHLMALDQNDTISRYKKLGYRTLLDKPTVKLPNADGPLEIYVPMMKPILYHIKTEMDQD